MNSIDVSESTHIHFQYQSPIFEVECGNDEVGEEGRGRSQGSIDCPVPSRLRWIEGSGEDCMEAEELGAKEGVRNGVIQNIIHIQHWSWVQCCNFPLTEQQGSEERWLGGKRKGKKRYGVYKTQRG
jgi:hypothetical protein